MREILFHGKRKDTGKWIEGSLWNYLGEFKILSPTNTVGYDVYPDTVSQYTGRIDKKKKKIFEGDILKFSKTGIYPVWYDEEFCTFGSCLFSDFDPLYKYDTSKIEVIGNIHDNPELLGGELYEETAD